MTRGLRLIVLVPLVAIAACGGGDDAPAPDPAPVPAGLKLAATSELSVAIPTGWTVETRAAKTGRPGDMIIEAIGPKGTDDLPVQLIVGATRNYDLSHQAQRDVNGLSNVNRFPGIRVLSTSDTEVKGAAQATLIESEVKNRVAGKPMTPVRIFDLLAISEKKTAVGLFIRLAAADVDSARVRDILASLVIK